MAVLKNKTQGRYVIIGMAPMRDRTLSVKERGLLFTIMALPDNWEFSVAGLAKILPDGRESLGRIVTSLEEKGYLTRTQSRSGDGVFGGNVIEVHEVPVREERIAENGQNPATENPASVFCPQNGQNPSTGNPATDNPSTGFQAQYSTYQDRDTESKGSINRSCDGAGSEDPSSLRSVGMTEGTLHVVGDSMEEYEAVRREILERIGYEALVHDYPMRIDTIDMIVEILIVIERSTQETMRIGGEPKPIEVVRSQMRKLDMFHVQYVLEGLESAGKIKNPTAYLMTSLYRSVFTMQMHVANHVECDMREGNEG